jgi:hypothetical protein
LLGYSWAAASPPPVRGPAAAEQQIDQVRISVAIGDLNGDKKPDLTIADSNGDDVSILLNNF